MFSKRKAMAAIVLSLSACLMQSQEIGERERHSSMIFSGRNGVMSAYVDGVDVTDEYIRGEKHLEGKIKEYMGENAFAEIEEIRFCHFNDNFYNMTAEFVYQGEEYCISMFDWEVKGLEKIQIRENTQ